MGSSLLVGEFERDQTSQCRSLIVAGQRNSIEIMPWQACDKSQLAAWLTQKATLDQSQSLVSTFLQVVAAFQLIWLQKHIPGSGRTFCRKTHQQCESAKQLYSSSNSTCWTKLTFEAEQMLISEQLSSFQKVITEFRLLARLHTVINY